MTSGVGKLLKVRRPFTLIYKEEREGKVSNSDIPDEMDQYRHDSADGRDSRPEVWIGIRLLRLGKTDPEGTFQGDDRWCSQTENRLFCIL